MCVSRDVDPSRWKENPQAASVSTLLLLLPLLLLAVSPFSARGEDFTIRSFRSEIEIRADSSLRVIETIEAEFHRSRHGIYREIPFRYVDELGKKSVTPLSVSSVTDLSGKGWKYNVSRRKSYIRIRIGDPKVYVNGRQTYVITYLVENGVLFFPDHDELYWNVTGNEWPVPIESATAVVTFGSGISPGTLRSRCFTGLRGSREEACSATADGDRTVFSPSRSFRPGEGMTVVLGWNKGFVHPPPPWKRLLFRLNLREYWPIVMPFLTLLFMLRLWYRKGRDPRTGDPLVVAYAPPEEGGRPLLPAEAGTLIDERLDPQDLSASVVNLAVKGCISITEEKSEGLLFDKTDYLLCRRKTPEVDLPSIERLLLEKLFEGQRSEVRISDLKLKFYKHLEALRNAAFEGLAQMRYFTGNPLSVKSRYVSAGVLIVGAGLLGGWLLQKMWVEESIVFPFSVAVSGGIVLLFSRFMPVKTLKGVKALEKIRGFEEFLMRAEKDRLERMNDPRLFEKYLPYAIALGVTEHWAKAFEGIYQEPPRWYTSESGVAPFHPSAFHHSLDSALSTMSSAMVAAPRSSGSGFSGGGGSGGGGGGGGGGSW
jgi:uncharacterized membrane protein YgcG